MEIMNKTYELIDVLNDSSLFKKMDLYKKKIMNNERLKELIDKGNNTDDEYILLAIKKDIYKYYEYKEYMRLYNDVMYIVMDINNRYKSLFLERKCRK